ncbi:MAG: hypothetical protein AAFU70_09810, partial [Planctomycetota bacterium]
MGHSRVRIPAALAIAAIAGGLATAGPVRYENPTDGTGHAWGGSDGLLGVDQTVLSPLPSIELLDITKGFEVQPGPDLSNEGEFIGRPIIRNDVTRQLFPGFSFPTEYYRNWIGLDGRIAATFSQLPVSSPVDTVVVGLSAGTMIGPTITVAPGSALDLLELQPVLLSAATACTGPTRPDGVLFQNPIGADCSPTLASALTNIAPFGATRLVLNFESLVLDEDAQQAAGVPVVNPEQYLGIEFTIDGQTHYGWISVIRNPTDVPAPAGNLLDPENVDIEDASGATNLTQQPEFFDGFELQLTGWGFETTPNTPIAAGAGELRLNASDLAAPFGVIDGFDRNRFDDLFLAGSVLADFAPSLDETLSTPVLDSADESAFLGVWCEVADQNEDGVLDDADVIAFVNQFTAGTSFDVN